MKRALMSGVSKRLFRKRSIIEMVNDELKNIAQVEQSKHKSFDTFIGELLLRIVFQRSLVSIYNKL